MATQKDIENDTVDFSNVSNTRLEQWDADIDQSMIDDPDGLTHQGDKFYSMMRVCVKNEIKRRKL